MKVLLDFLTSPLEIFWYIIFSLIFSGLFFIIMDTRNKMKKENREL
jgi:hypothetical protein